MKVSNSMAWLAAAVVVLSGCADNSDKDLFKKDPGENVNLDKRKAAVEMYLKTTDGENQARLHPAQPLLARMIKVESTLGDSGSASTGASSGATAAH